MELLPTVAVNPSALAAKNSFAPATNALRRSLLLANLRIADHVLSLPVSPAAIQRSMWLDWVALWIVISPVSGSRVTRMPPWSPSSTACSRTTGS